MTDDVKKGFNTTVGIVLALCFVFIVLPIGTCAGCMVLGTAASVGTATGVEGASTPTEAGPSGIEIENIAFKMLTDNQFMHEATYKFDVKNLGTSSVTKSFNVKFEDADGLPLDEDYVRRKKIPAGASITVTGKTSMSPEKGGQVTSMRVEER
jgi:hypothetical protein